MEQTKKTKKSGKKRPVRFRNRILVFFMLAVLVVASVGVLNYISFGTLMSSATDMFNRSYDLTLTYTKLNDVQSDLEDYAATTSSESLLSFYNNRDILLEYADEIRDNSSYTEKGIRLKNIANMLEHYLVTAEDTMTAKRGRNIEAYTEGFENSLNECTITTEYIKEVINDNVLENVENYALLNSRIQRTTLANGIIAAVVVIVIIVMIVIFSFEVTRPITKLSGYAREISDGNFNVEIPSTETSEEMHILYSAFNKMVLSINEYVNNLTEKAELEKNLSEEKMSNLQMQNTLHEIELKALQSQINPHFIFNTINIGAKMALLQGDNDTCTYLENAADIFRYNLRGLDMQTTVKDEIDNVCSYIFLLHTRFGEDSFEFITKGIDNTELCRAQIPRLTLQPIVENAYIHGISNMESGGKILLEVTDDGEYVLIKISDNGIPISAEKIQRLLSGESEHHSGSRGHTTGIGVSNVLERLKIFCGRSDVMDIVSDENETCFIIKLNKAE